MLTLISSLVPWAGPRFAIGLAGIALASGLLGVAWLAGDLHGSSGRAVAVAACHAEWKIKTAEAETAYAQTIAAALAAAAAVEPVPADAAGVDRLCQQSPACRDRGPATAAR